MMKICAHPDFHGLAPVFYLAGPPSPPPPHQLDSSCNRWFWPQHISLLPSLHILFFGIIGNLTTSWLLLSYSMFHYLSWNKLFAANTLNLSKQVSWFLCLRPVPVDSTKEFLSLFCFSNNYWWSTVIIENLLISLGPSLQPAVVELLFLSPSRQSASL